MNAAALIEALAALPPDARVLIFDDYSRDAMNPVGGVVVVSEGDPMRSSLREGIYAILVLEGDA